jgi:primosomal protein N' (replication factor Y)
MIEKFFSVAVDAPLLNPLTYKLTDETLELSRGDSVHVPLGKRKAEGVVLNLADSNNDFKIKNIFEKNLDKPKIPEAYMLWLEWLSKYYSYPIGQITKLVFPPLKRGSLRKSKKSPVIPTIAQDTPPQLNKEQMDCIEGIQKEKGFRVHLLHGVTGSGKTEVYLKLLDSVLKQGKSCLILVPEISLTPQLLSRFAARFPDKVAVIHSHLTEREKTNQWWLAHSNEKPILLGARSALFCPRDNLGLIIIDEEHESTYKQDEKLKYNARDAAIVLGKQFNCPVILGSATPSLESWHNAKTGKYSLHLMENRVSSRPLPQIEIVSLTKESKLQNSEPISYSSLQLPFWLSPRLYEEMNLALKEKSQVALFLNRRGVAQYVQCFDCGFTYECPNCEISLTLHKKTDLICHYCNYSKVFTEKCPECKSEKISPVGLGTEQVENDICKLFPNHQIQRADRDEISNREQMEDLIDRMEKHDIDVLIGTQMIAKGLDFPKLNLVGLILADVGFHLPDFRASEKSFQLITQVAGRAGRHSQNPGRVIVQTFNPQHESLRFALENNFSLFADHELKVRKELHYPPFGKLTLLRFVGSTFLDTQRAAENFSHRVFQLKKQRTLYNDIHVLGPAPAPITKLKNKYRFHLLLKSLKPQLAQILLQEIVPDFSKGSGGVKVQIDIDPYNML